MSERLIENPVPQEEIFDLHDLNQPIENLQSRVLSFDPTPEVEEQIKYLNEVKINRTKYAAVLSSAWIASIVSIGYLVTHEVIDPNSISASRDAIATLALLGTEIVGTSGTIMSLAESAHEWLKANKLLNRAQANRNKKYALGDDGELVKV
jgi:hypothetical protein